MNKIYIFIVLISLACSGNTLASNVVENPLVFLVDTAPCGVFVARDFKSINKEGEFKIEKIGERQEVSTSMGELFKMGVSGNLVPDEVMLNSRTFIIVFLGSDGTPLIGFQFHDRTRKGYLSPGGRYIIEPIDVRCDKDEYYFKSIKLPDEAVEGTSSVRELARFVDITEWVQVSAARLEMLDGM